MNKMTKITITAIGFGMIGQAGIGADSGYNIGCYMGRVDRPDGQFGLPTGKTVQQCNTNMAAHMEVHGGTITTPCQRNVKASCGSNHLVVGPEISSGAVLKPFRKDVAITVKPALKKRSDR